MQRKIIKINEKLCNGCGHCANACAEGAIKIINGKAKLISDQYCDGLGNCIGHCPTGALKIIEREAESFNQSVSNISKKPRSTCPGQILNTQHSPLNNWPIQLALAPEHADYFNNAELIIAADCTAFAYLHYHQDLLKDKVLLICCPKLDDSEPYLRKLNAIFAQHHIKSISIIKMHVPCCSKLTTIIRAALQLSEKKQDIQEITIDNRGKLSFHTINY